jgi:glucose/arabinose dehydrogenase
MFSRCVSVLALLSILATSNFAQAQGSNWQEEYDVDPDHIALEEGYRIEPIAVRLSVPTTAIFNGEDLIVAESGFADIAKPRVLRIRTDGSVEILASEGLIAPVTGLLMHQGKLYISHRGKVSMVEGGALKDVVTGLPSEGDHQNNQIALGPDGRIYIGQGTVTNSGVVGEDNDMFGWLKKSPQAHDVPCQDIKLSGHNFKSANPLTGEGGAETGAYKPFGSKSSAGEVVHGDPKCNGAILSFNPDGSDLRVEAWGLRNPFGLEFDEGGQLWATYHGADVRGSRPIANDPDYIVKVQRGAWYGWPDFFDGKPATDAHFRPLGTAPVQFLWQEHPPLAKAFATIRPHAAANGITISRNDTFGYKGDAFIALFGAFAPVTTNVQDLTFSGFEIDRVSLKDGSVHDFAQNKVPGPALLNKQEGFNRPSDVVFGPDGSLYVVDWGSSTLTADGLESSPDTGVIWRIYKDKVQQAKRPEGPIAVASAAAPPDERKPLVANTPSTYRQLWPVLVLLGFLILVAVAVKMAVIRKRTKARS